MESITDNDTFTLVPRSEVPASNTVITTKWVLTIKRDAAGILHRYKARLVARGFQQKEGIDYTEVFAPTTKLSTVRTLAALAAARGWDMCHIDIQTAFLNGVLPDDETAYVSTLSAEFKTLGCYGHSYGH